MDEIEKIKRDIGTTNETIRLEWLTIVKRGLGGDERRAAISRIQSHVGELSQLLDKLARLE